MVTAIRSTRCWCIALALGFSAAAFGCETLLGYGDEVGRVAVTPERGFELEFEPRNDQSHELWLKFDVEFTGPDFRLQGPLELRRGDEVLGAWTLALGREVGPIEGESSRKSFGTRELTINRHSEISSTVHLVSLPPSPAGQPVRLQGRWSAPGTQVNELELIVTD